VEPLTAVPLCPAAKPYYSVPPRGGHEPPLTRLEADEAPQVGWARGHVGCLVPHPTAPRPWAATLAQPPGPEVEYPTLGLRGPALNAPCPMEGAAGGKPCRETGRFPAPRGHGITRPSRWPLCEGPMSRNVCLFLDCARPISLLGVFWILPLVGVRRCLSRAGGLSLIPFRNHKRHTRRNAPGCLTKATT